MGKTTRIPDEIRAKAIQRLDAGEKAKDIADDLGFAEVNIYRWRKEMGRKAKAPSRKRSQPTMLTMPIPADEDERIVILIGSASKVTHALESLARIKG